MFDEMALRGINASELFNEQPASTEQVVARRKHETYADRYWTLHRYGVTTVPARPKVKRMSAVRRRLEMYESRAKRFRQWERDIELAEMNRKSNG